jgi:hypothetical protein
MWCPLSKIAARCPSVFLFALTAASTASAADRVWLTAGTGLFDEPSMWLGGVPGPRDAAEFGLLPSTTQYFVLLTEGRTLGALRVEDQRPTIDLGGTWLDVLGAVSVGGLAGLNPSLTVRSGLLQPHSLLVGEGPGESSCILANLTSVDVGEGVVRVAEDADSVATLILASEPTPWSEGAILYAGQVEVGAFGEGVLHLEPFAYAEANDTIRLGVESGSRGTLRAETLARVVTATLEVGVAGQALVMFQQGLGWADQVTVAGPDGRIELYEGELTATDLLIAPAGEGHVIAYNSSLDLKRIVVDGDEANPFGGATLELVDSWLFLGESLRLTDAQGSSNTTIAHVQGTGTLVQGPGSILIGEDNAQSGFAIRNGALVDVEGDVSIGSYSWLELELTAHPGVPIRCGTFFAGGELDVLFAPGETLENGESRVLVEADAIVGGFDSVFLPPGVDAAIVMNATRIMLVGQSPQLGDLTGDGAVNAADLSVLLGLWGSANSIADLNGDGIVAAGDLAILLAEWS